MNEFLTIITTAYTVVALMAVLLHGLNFREARRNQHAIRSITKLPDTAPMRDMVDVKLGEEWAKMSVRIEFSRLLKAILIAGLGIGVLVGFREIGWILIPIPVIGLIASWLDLRSRERQAIYAEALLARDRAANAKAAGETPQS